MKRRGILPDEFDVDTDQQFIEEEVLAGLSSLDLDQGEDELPESAIGDTGTGEEAGFGGGIAE